MYTSWVDMVAEKTGCEIVVTNLLMVANYRRDRQRMLWCYSGLKLETTGALRVSHFRWRAPRNVTPQFTKRALQQSTILIILAHPPICVQMLHDQPAVPSPLPNAPTTRSL
jgi:hypothetical protein